MFLQPKLQQILLLLVQLYHIRCLVFSKHRLYGQLCKHLGRQGLLVLQSSIVRYLGLYDLPLNFRLSCNIPCNRLWILR